MFDKMLHHLTERLEEKQDELHATMLLLLAEVKQTNKHLAALRKDLTPKKDQRDV